MVQGVPTLLCMRSMSSKRLLPSSISGKSVQGTGCVRVTLFRPRIIVSTMDGVSQGTFLHHHCSAVHRMSLSIFFYHQFIITLRSVDCAYTGCSPNNLSQAAFPRGGCKVQGAFKCLLLLPTTASYEGCSLDILYFQPPLLDGLQGVL